MFHKQPPFVRLSIEIEVKRCVEVIEKSIFYPEFSFNYSIKLLYKSPPVAFEEGF